MKRFIFVLLALTLPAAALADVAVTTSTGGGYDLFRSSTKISHWANKAECEAARDRDADALKKPSQNYSCREVWDTYTVKYITPATAVDCAVSDFGAWQDTMTGACSGGMVMGSQVRSRTITRQPANGGKACPALTETHEVHSPCGAAAVKMTLPLRGTEIYTTLRVQAAADNDENRLYPDPSRYGAFRVPCSYSHIAYDDPIVFPDQPGKSHAHTFFGSTITSASTTTPEALNKGGSTCRGGTANRSAYWIPSIIDTGLNQFVIPDATLTYYKDGFFDPKTSPINKPPNGLKMIAGNPVTWDSEIVGWDGPLTQNDVHHAYECWSDKLPDGRGGRRQYFPPCPVGGEILMELAFPQCWDGKNLDSPDHRSHMAYPDPTHPCPADHPVPIVSISFNIHIPVREGQDPTKWRLASDAYGLDKPGGFSTHGDVIVNWDEDVKESWFQGCIKAGADCHAHLIGGGKMLY